MLNDWVTIEIDEAFTNSFVYGFVKAPTGIAPVQPTAGGPSTAYILWLMDYLRQRKKRHAKLKPLKRKKKRVQFQNVPPVLKGLLAYLDSLNMLDLLVEPIAS